MAIPTIRILVVDDDEPTRDLITLTLREADYQVETAADGEQAVAAILANPPQLVVLDYALPRLSGRDVLRRMAAAHLSHVPVLVLSASIYAEQCVDEGAADFLPKPFDLDRLRTVITRCLT